MNKLIPAAFAAAFALSSAAASAAPHTLDPSHSFVIFKASHFGIANAYGMFTKISGNFDPEKGSVEVEIDANSLFTGNKKRDDHLKSPDFFNAKQHAKVTFKGEKAEKTADGFKVMGKLTMKGKTNPVVMTVKKTGEGKGPQGKFRTGFEATMTVDRIAFGVDTYPGALSNNVELIISVEGIKQ